MNSLGPREAGPLALALLFGEVSASVLFAMSESRSLAILTLTVIALVAFYRFGFLRTLPFLLLLIALSAWPSIIAAMTLTALNPSSRIRAVLLLPSDALTPVSLWGDAWLPLSCAASVLMLIGLLSAAALLARAVRVIVPAH